MELDKEKLKNFDKLPPDVRRQFSLLMNRYAEKKKQLTECEVLRAQRV